MRPAGVSLEDFPGYDHSPDQHLCQAARASQSLPDSSSTGQRFQPLNLGAISCATKENKYNSCLLSPYYALGTVPCTEHYESWRWLSECLVGSHFQSKNLEVQESVSKLAQTHRVRKWWSWNLNWSTQGPESHLHKWRCKNCSSNFTDRIALLAHALKEQFGKEDWIILN